MHYRELTQGELLYRVARQADLTQWYFGARPVSDMVSARRDYFLDPDHPDNLMCILGYEAAHGYVRAFHQSLTTLNESENRFEKFLGSESTILVSGAGLHAEIKVTSSGIHDGHKWKDLADSGFIRRVSNGSVGFDYYQDDELGFWSQPTYPPDTYELPGSSPKPALELHLANFFDAIRGRAKLNCDARTAFAGEAPVYYMHAAAESGETHRFTPEQLGV